ncbi:hypothetical protein GE21DRAFT_6003 [Neurospora crassa]|uniref:Integral membrane protein n=1 Tax=Neurospora crassa (strain ATCC 24698 / 74-OR23-1A / CBS 708.71 / DSM 1257 / FGSC 987) TaxID=367110 RepID=Q7RYA8_NEUCR|nr:hypothetical protein NCU04499 [Neurospora crassa OR74A]EAA27832.2 hypothetical protein NCU04499 [Neurospora crassa OR74A]KHE88663.1 hypothetical protein GE21DRAFT_6003 [Neurospora crassa]|eukprot:XP_957068.2 hypothetical protein NCU04499 [Neurospora crassa OR74A]
MVGFLIPPWYKLYEPTESDLILATFLWGFTLALAICVLAKGVKQTLRSFRRCHFWNPYIIMIWVEWASCLGVAVISWLFLRGVIQPSFWYFLTLIIAWTIKTQCLMQILTNRISLILYNPEKARKLKVYIFLAIGVINVSVFIVWIPARLQVSETWIHVNEVWDRVEKFLFMAVDGGLNYYFMWLIKSKLVANGLTKYRLVYRFNLFMVFISLSLDVLIIALMSLRNDALYVQVHPLTYMAKLYIEMNIAEFLGKILKQSNRRHNSFSLSIDCHSLTTFDGWRPDLEATGSPHDYIFNREWRRSKHQFHIKPSGGQMHPLNMDILTGGEESHDCTNKWGGIHGAGLYDISAEKEDEVGKPSIPSEVRVKDSPWSIMDVKRRSSSQELRQSRRVRPRTQRAETCAGYDDGKDNNGDTGVDRPRAKRCISQDYRSSRSNRDNGSQADLDTDGLLQGAIPPTKTYSDHEQGG